MNKAKIRYAVSKQLGNYSFGHKKLKNHIEGQSVSLINQCIDNSEAEVMFIPAHPETMDVTNIVVRTALVVMNQLGIEHPTLAVAT